MKSEEAWILLNHLFYLATHKTIPLLEYFNNRPEDIFQADKATLTRIMNEEWAEKILHVGKINNKK